MQQLALTTGTLWGATANAAGIRAHEDVPSVTTSPAVRALQTAGLVMIDLGCYLDNEKSRVFDQGLMDQTDLTPDTCALYCFSEGYQYCGLQYGKECWCGEAGTDYDRHGALDMSECDYPCTGDASLSCGGGYAEFHAYELVSQNQPTPAPSTIVDKPTAYLGCYTDARSRLFSTKSGTSTSDNSAEA
ncbi:unnamed protein product, partial [Ectocarpus sp. 6 AP-2014]